jgi:hypothetical protein
VRSCSRFRSTYPSPNHRRPLITVLPQPTIVGLTELTRNGLLSENSHSGIVTPWWRTVFVDGLGPAAVAGLFSVVVARLTVSWTLARQRDQIRLEQSESAAAALAACLVDLSQRLLLTKPGIEPDYHDWWRQSTLLAHHLQCVPLRGRILFLNAKLRDYTVWNIQLTADVRSQAARWSLDGWPKYVRITFRNSTR